MKAKTVLLVIIILSLLSSSGCSDYTEYERLALLASLGVDFDNTAKQVTVTVEYMITSNATQQGTGGGGSVSKSNSESIKATGSTITEALSKIQQTTRKKLFYSYLTSVVIGEDAAKNIMADILRLIDRTPEIRTSTYLSITAGKAENVLSTVNPKAFVATGKIIHDMIDQSVNSGSAFPVTIEAFAENLSVSGKNCTAPRVNVINRSKDNGSSSNGSNSKNDSSSSGSSNDVAEQDLYKFIESKNGYHIIDGLAAFNGEKLVGWLEGKECIGFGWIMNNKIKPYENVQVTDSNESKKTLSFSVSKSKSKVKIKLNNNNPEITINTFVEADLGKYAEGISQEVLTPDVIALMEEKLSESVKSDIDAAINKGQKELKTDIFCFGFDFFRQYPEQWQSSYEKKWDQIFPDIPIKINVTAKIINTGTNIKRFTVK